MLELEDKRHALKLMTSCPTSKRFIRDKSHYSKKNMLNGTKNIAFQLSPKQITAVYGWQGREKALDRQTMERILLGIPSQEQSMNFQGICIP